MTLEPNTELPVGDPARRQAERAILGALGLAVLFMLFNWTAKKLPGLFEHEPWRDDPYDVMVSLTIFWVPLLTLLCLMRVLPSRRKEPQPIRRLRELLRGSVVLLAVVAATLTSDWISVVLQVHRSIWNGDTAIAIGGLAVVSLAAVAIARALRRAARPPFPAVDGPDWLSDMVLAGKRVAGWLGPLRPIAMWAVLLVDRSVVNVVRRHPLLVAGALSLAFGLSTALLQGLAEGYTLPVYLVLFTNHVASMFAYLTITGAFLGLAGTPPQQRAGTRSTAARRHAVHAGIVACVSVPVTGAFRVVLWSALGGQPDRESQAYDLVAMMLTGAALMAVLTYVVETIMDRTGRWGPTSPQQP
jgi:hypothetical protein